jgi:hypothetical protein
MKYLLEKDGAIFRQIANLTNIKFNPFNAFIRRASALAK